MIPQKVAYHEIQNGVRVALKTVKSRMTLKVTIEWRLIDSFVKSHTRSNGSICIYVEKRVKESEEYQRNMS